MRRESLVAGGQPSGSEIENDIFDQDEKKSKTGLIHSSFHSISLFVIHP